MRLLAPHLTSENAYAVLESARGKRKSEVEEMVARLAPRPDVSPSIRRLPAAKATLPAEELSPLRPPAAEPTLALLPAEADLPVAAPLTLPVPPRSTASVPLSPDRYKLQLTIDGEILQKLRLAKDMLRHTIPSGDEAAILDRALTTLLADLAKKKFAATHHPGDPPRSTARATEPGSRHIPATVKRAVWLRDLGRCAFKSTGGHRCAERAFVEFHHCWPRAAGGEATVENCELRCKRHNDYEARTHPATRSRTSRRRLRSEREPRAILLPA